jgi:hypothetical protein
MGEKTFLRLFLALLVLCLVLTILHTVYAIYAYRHCSIIYFIGKELWG